MDVPRTTDFIKRNGTSLLVLFSTIFLYLSYIPDWFKKWTDFDSFYSFFPFLCIFIYQFFQVKSNVLSQIDKKPLNLGLIPLLIGFALYFIAIRADVPLFLGLSFPLIVSGTVLFLYGAKIFKAVLPVIILVFVSIPVLPITRLTAPLQIILSDIATQVLVFFNINAQNFGSSIFIDNNPVTVAAGCTGVKSLSSLLIVSLMLCYFKNISTLQKIGLLSFAMICSFAGNITRIILIAFYVVYNGLKGVEAFHYWAGVIIFAITLAIIILVNGLVEERNYVEAK